MREHGTSLPGYNFSGKLEFLTVRTLFDITRTNVLKPYYSLSPAFIDAAGQFVNSEVTWDKSRDQQRNWETLVQLLSLRAQPVMLEDSQVLVVSDIHALGFGSNYSDSQSVWSFSLAYEHFDIYSLGTDPAARIKQESQMVPMVTGLNESVTFNTLYIDVNGPNTNTIFLVSDHVTSQYAGS